MNSYYESCLKKGLDIYFLYGEILTCFDTLLNEFSNIDKIYYNTIESFRLKIIESLIAISEKRGDQNRTKENELKNLRVFISYNHKDSKAAEEIKKKLTDLGINVIIDSEALSSGMDIESFIKESILNTDLTISVVSKNSLLSSWVAMESIESFSKETRSSIKFLPFVLDKTFLDRKFTG